MLERWRFFLARLGERLWVRPLVISVLSVAALFVARVFDDMSIQWLPAVTAESVDRLLSIMAASMLVIATFAVSSMVAAYASAGNAATPRSFPLIIADDTSQNALSTFVGAFIFSIVGLVASMNGLFQEAGRFALFALTLATFAIVILTFVRWVDRIARLGRIGNTIERVEEAAMRSLRRRRSQPHLGAVAPGTFTPEALAGRALAAGASPAGASAAAAGGERGRPVHGPVGYVQRVELEQLQELATDRRLRITVASVPGTFATPDRALAYVTGDHDEPDEEVLQKIVEGFVIGSDRTFDEDPRFGLIVLSEIACRALSPAVNDAGTAIDVIGSLVRLLLSYREPFAADEKPGEVRHSRIAVPELALADMFDDAFNAIARDGAAIVEVGARLQKAFSALASTGDGGLLSEAVSHSSLALARAEKTMQLPEDLAVLRRLSLGVGAERSER